MSMIITMTIEMIIMEQKRKIKVIVMYYVYYASDFLFLIHHGINI